MTPYKHCNFTGTYCGTITEPGLPVVQQANVDDEEIARAINFKLGETPGISYSEIASKAMDCGRTHLAIKVS